MHISVIGDSDRRSADVHIVRKRDRPAARNRDVAIGCLPEEHVGEHDPLRILDNGSAEANLAAIKYVTVVAVQNLNTDTRIISRMMKYAADTSSVGIVRGLSLAVVHQETILATAEIAIDEHIIATVVDAAIQAAEAPNVRELVKLAPIRHIDASAAVADLSVRHAQVIKRAVPGIVAGDTAAREPDDSNVGHKPLFRLQVSVVVGGIVALPQNAVPPAYRFGQGNVLAGSANRQVTDLAIVVHLHRVPVGSPGKAQFSLGAAAAKCRVFRHIQVVYHKQAGAKVADASLRQHGGNVGGSIRGIACRSQIVVRVCCDRGCCGHVVRVAVLVKRVLIRHIPAADPRPAVPGAPDIPAALVKLVPGKIIHELQNGCAAIYDPQEASPNKRSIGIGRTGSNRFDSRFGFVIEICTGHRTLVTQECAVVCIINQRPIVPNTTNVARTFIKFMTGKGIQQLQDR